MPTKAAGSKRRPRTPRWTARHFALVVVVLCLAVPMLVTTVYVFLPVTDVIPSQALRPLRVYGAPIAAVVCFAVVLSQVLPSLRRAPDRQWFRDALVLLGTAPFACGLWCAFVTRPLTYVCHHLAGAQRAEQVERVIHAGRGNRHCRGRAQFESDGFPARELCGLSAADVVALANGGKVRMFGTASAFGFQPEGYVVEPE